MVKVNVDCVCNDIFIGKYFVLEVGIYEILSFIKMYVYYMY